MFVPPVNVADTRGFSLVEMAIALFIFALVISSILEPAADLYERRKNTAAREYLDTASQAVLDYALRNRTIYREIDYDGVAPAESIPDGRPYLPCPDTDGDGIENRNLIPAGIPIPRASLTVAGTCDQHKGTLPWKTLEMQQGTDPWGNRLTYHADSSYSNALFGFDETTRADKHDTRMPPPTGAMTIYPPKSTVALSPFVVCGYNATTICSEVIAGVASNANITIGARQYTSGILTNAIVEGVAFLVLSHGQNGRYARDGESGNCNSGDGVVVANFNPTFGGHEFRNGWMACNNQPTSTTDPAVFFYFDYPQTDLPTTGQFDDILRWTMADEIMGALTNGGALPIGKLPFLE